MCPLNLATACLMVHSSHRPSRSGWLNLQGQCERSGGERHVLWTLAHWSWPECSRYLPSPRVAPNLACKHKWLHQSSSPQPRLTKGLLQQPANPKAVLCSAWIAVCSVGALGDVDEVRPAAKQRPNPTLGPSDASELGVLSLCRWSSRHTCCSSFLQREVPSHRGLTTGR